MTTQEFEFLKKKIELAKQQNQRIQGAIDQIKAGWKQKYGFETVEEAEAKLKEFEEAIETQKKRKEVLEEKLLASLPQGMI